MFLYIASSQEPPHDLSHMLFGKPVKKSIVTTSTVLSAAVAAVAAQTTELTPALPDIQAMIGAAVATAMRHKTNTLSKNSWKSPPAGGWSCCWLHGRLRNKNTTAPLAKTKRKDIKMKQHWRIKWLENCSSGTTPEIVDEMEG